MVGVCWTAMVTIAIAIWANNAGQRASEYEQSSLMLAHSIPAERARGSSSGRTSGAA